MATVEERTRLREGLGPAEEGDSLPLSSEARAVARGVGTLNAVDLPARAEARVDGHLDATLTRRKPMNYAAVTRWWRRAMTDRFGQDPGPISPTKGTPAGRQWRTFLDYVGSEEQARKVLTFVLDRWAEIVDAWGVWSPRPDPAFLCGFRKRIVASEQRGVIHRNREEKPGGYEDLEEWS